MLALIVASAVLVSPLPAQSGAADINKDGDPAEFEVATINPHPANDFTFPVEGPPGRFEARNVTAIQLIELAFDIPAMQVSGGPAWASSQRFDVSAKISDSQWQDLNRLGDDDRRKLVVQQMLQSLLTRRFQLAVSHQQKDLLVFALVVAKSGAKLPEAGTPSPELNQSRELLMALNQNNVSVSALASFLSARFGRTVLDNTGLSRKYDISLKVEIPDDNSPEAVDRAIFKALEYQLGLKLVTRRWTVDTIAIDRLEQPSAN
jgi:uncharacterized protein (TIGR03435 family)